MSHSETIHSIVYSSANSEIAKRTCISSVLTSFAMLIGGAMAFSVTFSLDDKSSTISMALMVLGTALLLTGVFRLFWKSRHMVYLPTGSSTKEFSLYFDLKYLQLLQDMLNTGCVPSGAKYPSASSGNVRMDVLYSADEKFAAVQLFQFIPYTYEPVTVVSYFKNEDARALLSFVMSNK